MEDKFREEFGLLLEKTIFSGDMDEKNGVGRSLWVVLRAESIANRRDWKDFRKP